MVLSRPRNFLFTLHRDKRRLQIARRATGQMDNFIERTIKERRTLNAALADLLAKYILIPPGSERSALERMIDGLRAEITFRKTASERR
jgi:hypothetical protein